MLSEQATLIYQTFLLFVLNFIFEGGRFSLKWWEQGSKPSFSLLFDPTFPCPYFKYSINLFPHPGPFSFPYSQHFLFYLRTTYSPISRSSQLFLRGAISPFSRLFCSPPLQKFAATLQTFTQINARE